MTQSWFYKRLGNGLGTKILRTWLVYSPTKGAAYCFCCLLFARADGHNSALTSSQGFTKWKNIERMDAHENAPSHRACFADWKELERNLRTNSAIDIEVQSVYATEKQKWRYVLSRISHCIKFLATQNLPLRGHRENQCEDVGNIGNFLGLMKLVANFDPIIKDHMTRSRGNPGSTSYLGSRTQNELIHLMAGQVKEKLLRKIRKAKYYGILVDSTPDLAHREQLSFVLRYVRKSFLGFVQVHEKNAEALVATILKKLEDDKLDFGNCRSQCYDNAAVMAGHRSGVNQRLLEKNGLALFVNCDNHSLNLAGLHSARSEPAMISFFATIEALYAFFSRSTLRWEKLKKTIPVGLKRESETRWSSRSDAVKVVSTHVREIIDLLDKMSDDSCDSVETRSEARQLFTRMVSYEFLTLHGFWNNLLSRVDRVQKRLQDPSMNFHEAANDLSSLKNTFSREGCDFVDAAITDGQCLCDEYDVAFEKRNRRRRSMPDEHRNSEISAIQEMRRVMYSTIDRLQREMRERFERLTNLDNTFGFLLDTQRLLQGQLNELRSDCLSFANMYSDDVDGNDLYREICDCRMLVSVREELRLRKPEELLNFIIEYGDESVFPNLRVAIQILLTIAVSIASCERSFSKLKLILSYLRASMGQDRLIDLSIMSIEREVTEDTDFESLIDTFASVKARKVVF
ncbi:uncharacterized protein LOC100903808 [Galendromus occidentalis]|uniref:Uncharacterized protein LOC100903808 n=3 Tax=Galendromus occidentalis TaxID=34638 RepID=A0AAJ7WIS5_9ACAR|nr:uncharacterized protein LOC100903808 [Galendromus occidentalis]